jgi:CRP-like cAMP-binding protein
MPDFLTQDSNLSYEFLNAEECLNFLTDDEKQELVDKKTDIEFNSGEVIIKRGLLANNIVYITEGLAKLEIVNGNRTSTVAILKSHSFIGIVCCFAFEKFDFTATAIAKTKVSFVGMEVFEKFIMNNGEFALNLIKHMSGVSNRLLHRLTDLSQKNIEGAISFVLMDFAKIYNSTEFELPMSRTEIGNMLGYSKESVINTLSKFKREGIINVSDRKIKILNSKKLEQIYKVG